MGVWYSSTSGPTPVLTGCARCRTSGRGQRSTKSAGLTVLGVHTPEFGFESNMDSVVAQSRSPEVEYPVAVDSEYRVWGAYSGRRVHPAGVAVLDAALEQKAGLHVTVCAHGTLDRYFDSCD